MLFCGHPSWYLGLYSQRERSAVLLLLQSTLTATRLYTYQHLCHPPPCKYQGAKGFCIISGIVVPPGAQCTTWFNGCKSGQRHAFYHQRTCTSTEQQTMMSNVSGLTMPLATGLSLVVEEGECWHCNVMMRDVIGAGTGSDPGQTDGSAASAGGDGSLAASASGMYYHVMMLL